MGSQEEGPLKNSALRRFALRGATGLVLFWLTHFILTGQPNFSTILFERTILDHALFGLLALAYAAYLVVNRRLPGRTPLDWLAACIILVYAAAIIASVSPSVSLEAALLPAAALLSFYAIHDFKFLTTALLIRGIVGIAILVALAGLFEALATFLEWLELVRSVEGSVGISSLIPPTVPRAGGFHHPIMNALLLNLALPFALVLMLRPERPFDRSLGAVALVLCLAALFFSLSRGAWIATFSAAAVFAVAALDWRSLRDSLARAPACRNALLAVAVLLPLISGSILASGLLQTRPQWLFRETVSPRLEMALVGQDIFLDQPLLGAGPYTYGLLYESYGGETPIDAIHPHNSYVSFLVETGLAGGIIVLIGALFLAAKLVSSLRGARGHHRLWLTAAAASLTTLVVHSLAASPNNDTSALVALAVVLAITMRLMPAIPATTRPLIQAARLLVLALIPTLIALWSLIDLNHAQYQDSLDLLADGRYESAASRAAAAADAEPWAAAYQFNAGVSLALLHLEETVGESDNSSANLEESVAYLEQGLRADPRSALGYANLAEALRLAGDRPAAVEAALQARSLAPFDGTIAVISGTVLEWAGLMDEAISAYGSAVRLDENLSQSTFWSSTPQRIAMRSAVIEASGLNPCQLGRAAVLYATDDDEFEVLARECQALVADSGGAADDRAALALLLLVRGNDSEAIEEARRAVDDAPGSLHARTALGLALSAQGDLQGMRHQLLVGAYYGSADARLLLTFSYAVDMAMWPALERLSFLQSPEPPPASVLAKTETSLPTFDRLGMAYFRVELLRDAPTLRYIPGDWQDLTSPRTKIALNVLNSP